MQPNIPEPDFVIFLIGNSKKVKQNEYFAVEENDLECCPLRHNGYARKQRGERLFELHDQRTHQIL